MNYDKAHELAREIVKSDEYIEYARAKEEVSSDPDTLGLLKEVRRLEVKCQAAMVTGESDSESLEKLNRLMGYLAMNEAAGRYLMAEFNLNRAIGDIYRIIAEAAGLDMSMLQ